jgi:hypothetical protein
MTTRVQHYIRNIIFNSNLNREKFTKNLQKINTIKNKNKNNNITIKRNIHTTTYYNMYNSTSL